MLKSICSTGRQRIDAANNGLAAEGRAQVLVRVSGNT
jgi:hypothetical protein